MSDEKIRALADKWWASVGGAEACDMEHLRLALDEAWRSAEREARAAALEEAAKVCDAMDEECEAMASASDGANSLAASEYRAEAWAHHKAAKRIRSLKETP